VTPQARYAAFFHELDAWTEYWDVYHPETKGRYYFGDGATESGLLTKLLPNKTRPPVYVAWCRMALGCGSREDFLRELAAPDVRSALVEIDEFVVRLVEKHFGNLSDEAVQDDYLEAVFQFATDRLPAATEREARVEADDPRKSTAGRHTMDNDVMWFAWAFEIEAAHVAKCNGGEDPVHSLLMTGVVTGCAANFAWRGHRRTRAEYQPTMETRDLLRRRALRWRSDVQAAADEARALYRIREWGHE
jgi:hypothetical protein